MAAFVFRGVASSFLVMRESVRSFSRNRNLETAATLAYYGFLSLMPLLLLLIFLLSWIVASSDTVFSALQELIEELFPTFDAALLQELALLARNRVWGLVGFAVLLWSMTPFAGAFRNAIIDIFKGMRRPAFWLAKLVDLAAVLSLLVLFLLLVASRIVLVALPIELTQLAKSLHAVFAWLLSALIIGVAYKIFAPVSLRWREALAGAFVAALLMSVIRPLFGLLIDYNPNFGYAFGSLKAVFLLLVWTYYTFAALLFGAEVSANMRRREAVFLRRFLADASSVPRASYRLLEPFLRRPEAGEILFREGDAGGEMYFVRSGAVRLTRGDVELGLLGAGDYFGEMSMLLGAKRSATATVVEPETELVAISDRNVDIILHENPAIVQRLLRDMSARVQAMNERVATER